MTAIEHYEGPQITFVPTPQDQAIQRLGEWAQSADAAYKVAVRLVESSFVPQGFRGKPIEATAAILAGIEVGLSPMSALRAFDVIQGQAAPRAITLRAIAQSHGHEMELVESTATRCRMRGRRRGAQAWQNVAWTIDRAKEMGLLSREQWKKQPQAMLVARATSELARLVASDAILGIGYSSEEIGDGEQAQGDAPAAAEPTTTRMARRKPVAAVSEPDFTDGGPAEDETGEPITDPQMKWLQAHYKDVDREERLNAAAAILGHDVESFSGLTKAQASVLIDHLADPIAEHEAALNAEAAQDAAERGLFGGGS